MSEEKHQGWVFDKTNKGMIVTVYKTPKNNIKEANIVMKK